VTISDPSANEVKNFLKSSQNQSNSKNKGTHEGTNRSRVVTDNDNWVLDRVEMQHNHEPQSEDFFRI
jgi:ribose 5-phosphate isomerase